MTTESCLTSLHVYSDGQSPQMLQYMHETGNCGIVAGMYGVAGIHAHDVRATTATKNSVNKHVNIITEFTYAGA